MCCWCAWYYGPPPEPEPEPRSGARSAKRRRKQAWKCSALRLVGLMLFIQTVQALGLGGDAVAGGAPVTGHDEDTKGSCGGCLSAQIAPLNRAYSTHCNRELAAVGVETYQETLIPLASWGAGVTA